MRLCCVVVVDFQVPTGETLAFGDENYIKFEEAGVLEATPSNNLMDSSLATGAKVSSKSTPSI